MGKHIRVMDTSAYGYVGTAIEKFQDDKVQKLLAQYKKDNWYENVEQDLSSITRGKSLVDLAIDNITYAQTDEQLDATYSIIETLITDEAIDLNIIDQEDRHSALSHVLELYREYEDNEEVSTKLAEIAQRICERDGFEPAMLYYPDDTLENLHSLNEILGDKKIQPILMAVATEALKAGNKEAGVNIFRELARDEELKFNPQLTDNAPLAKQLLEVYRDGGLPGDLVYGLLATAIDTKEDEQQNSLLHLAASMGDDELVSRILESSHRNLEIKNSKGNTALKQAMLEDHYNVAIRLVKAGAMMDFDLGVEKFEPTYDFNGYEEGEVTKVVRYDPLESACDDGQDGLELAEAIIASPNYKIDPERATLEIIYNSEISKQILPAFLEHAAKIQRAIKYEDFKAVLEDACNNGKTTEAIALLQYYRDINGNLLGLDDPKNVIDLKVVKTIYDKVAAGGNDELKPLLKALTQTFKINPNQTFIKGGYIIGKEKNVLQALLQSDDPSLAEPLLQADNNSITYPIFKSALEEMIDQNKPVHALKLLEFFARKNYRLDGLDSTVTNLIDAAHLGKIYQRAYKGKDQNAQEYQQLFANILSTNLIDLSQQIVTVPGSVYHTYKTVQQAIIETNDYELYNKLFNHPNFNFANLSEKEKFEIAQYVTALPYREFRELVDNFFVGNANTNVSSFVTVVTQELIQQDKIAYLDYLQAKKVIPDEIELFKKQDAIALYKQGNVEVLKYLLYKEIDLNQVDEQGNSLLHLAAANGHKELALALIKQGALLQEKNIAGLTPLAILCMSDNPQNQAIAKAIIESTKFEIAKERVKLAIGKKQNQGELPLILLAYLRGNAGIATMILDKLDKTSLGVEEHKVIIQKAFITACFSADVELVKMILANNEELNINQITNKGDSSKSIQPIFELYNLYKGSQGKVRENYFAILQEIINQERFLINQANIKGQSLLTVAAADGEIELVKVLLAQKERKGLELNAKPKGISPLAGAYQTLVSLEAENKPENRKRINKLYKTLILLLGQKDISTNIENRSTEESILVNIYKELQHLKKQNKPEDANRILNIQSVVEAFLANANTKTNLNKDKDGKDLLMLAIEAKDKSTFDKLIKREPNLAVEQTDKAGNTAIFYAYASGNQEFVDALVREGASLDVKNDQNTNVLMAACRGGNLQLIKSLLSDESIFEDEQDKNGNSAIHYFVHSELKEITEMHKVIKILEERGFNLNAVNNDNQSALILAVLKGDLNKVNALLAAGVDVNIKDKDGNTALIYACLLDRSDIAQKILSSNQIDVNITNNDGLSAYMLAAVRGNCNGMSESWKGDPRLMQALINHGADPVFGSYYSGLADKLKLTFAKATVIAVANQAVAQLMPIPLLKDGIGTMNAINTGLNVYKDVSTSTENMIREFLNNGTERAVKIDLADSYTGYHIGRFGIVTYGGKMKTLVEKHNFFEHADRGLYNAAAVAKWSHANEGDPAKQQQLYKSLVAQYFNVDKQLQGFLWPWTRSAFNTVARDIETASTYLLPLHQNPHDKGEFKDRFPGFSEMINPRSRDRYIVYLLEHPEKAKDFHRLIDAIIKDEILVSPKTYSEAIQFQKRMQEIELEKENPSIFRKMFGFAAGRKLGKAGIDKVDTLNPIIDDSLEDFKSIRAELQKEAEVAIEKQNVTKASGSYKEKALDLVASLIEKAKGSQYTSADLVEGIADVGGKVGGAASGVAVAAAMEPAKAGLLYNVASDGLKLGAQVVGAGYAVVSSTSVAAIATTLGTVLGVAALAGTAVYGVYKGGQIISDQLKATADFEALTPKNLEGLYAENVSLTHIKMFEERQMQGLRSTAAKDLATARELPVVLPVGVSFQAVPDPKASASMQSADGSPKVTGADRMKLSSEKETIQVGGLPTAKSA